MELNSNFWRKQIVLVTGHTGFKGSWLVQLLHSLGSTIHGYSLAPDSDDSLYDLADIKSLLTSEKIADLNDSDLLQNYMQEVNPTVVLHLAAQALVIDSYEDPINTYMSNSIGTLKVLEAARCCRDLRALVAVTTDKVYCDQEHNQAYIESDKLGGHDPYSASKACAELITDSYRKSFFSLPGSCNIASARAGNVIGGGDWSLNRLIPDCIKSFQLNKPVVIRNPNAIRPWQHVLEPLLGYLQLAENLSSNEFYGQAWNFGPENKDQLTSLAVSQLASSIWPNSKVTVQDQSSGPRETHCLKLNSSFSNSHLNWHPKLNAKQAVELTVNWYVSVLKEQKLSARDCCNSQIQTYLNL